MLVVFATPSKSGSPCIEYVRSAVRTQTMLMMNSVVNVWADLAGDPYISKARNRLASQFLTDYPAATDLFFIDDDVGWEAEAVFKFLFRDEDVVCGIYPKKNDSLEFPVEMLVSDGRVIENNGLYRAALAPTGFMRIKRHVLERCAEESGKYPETDLHGNTVWCWDLFRTGWIPDEPGAKIGRWWGEDYFFSFMCRVLGFEVWIDPNLDFSHTGPKSWKGNFNETLQNWVSNNNLLVHSREVLLAAE